MPNRRTIVLGEKVGPPLRPLQFVDFNSMLSNGPPLMLAVVSLLTVSR